MNTTFILFILVCISFAILCNSTCTRPPKICEKYCEIERTSCAGLKHPLCTEFDFTDVNSSFGKEILKLNNRDMFTILFEINRFRDDLAHGYVSGLHTAANLQAVKWSFDLQDILDAKLEYERVCTQITRDRTEFVEMASFEAQKSNFYYHLTGLLDNIAKSYNKIQWNALIRAEFNEIGCVVINDGSKYTLVCLTNTAYSENNVFNASAAYEMGYSCKKCQCSAIWQGLCDNDDSNFRKYHHQDHADDDHLIIMYIMIGLVILLIIIIAGVICLFWLCVECISKPNESGTYTLRHKFTNKRERDAELEKC